MPSRLVAAVIALVLALAARVPLALAQDKAEAATRPPLSIAIFTSSRSDLCFDPGDIAAIGRLTRLERDRVNRDGGVAGRHIALKFYDDARDPARTTANLRAAMADPQTIAMVGLSNSERAKAAFGALEKELETSSIPFLSDLSVTSLFERFPSVYTTRASQEDERLPVMTQFIRRAGFERPAFVGIAGAVFSQALGDGLNRSLGDGRVVTDVRLAAKGNAPLERGEIDRAVAAIRESRPDLLVLGLGGARAAEMMKAIAAVGAAPAIFLTGRIDSLPEDVAKSYPNALYQLAWDRLPEAESDRLRRLISKGSPASWVFEGRKVDAAPGWASGQCKPRPDDVPPDPLSNANIRAIGIGTQYADMVGLVAAGARGADPTTDIEGLRRRILDGLTTTYAAGRGAFRGSFDNWSFHPEARGAVRTPFVVIQPRGLGRTQLAPLQFVRVKDGSLRPIETLYVDIDLVRAHRVEDNEKTFFAEFYLSMRDGKQASIEQIEFTNAYLDPRTNGRQITVDVMHGGGRSDAWPEGMKIYKVTGRFVFDPELARYPFDTQRFSIDLQPKRGDAPFIVQPPPVLLRDTEVATDGWSPRFQYVGYDEDFVPVIDAFTHTQSVVPFYKASFVWLMKRQATDYYLRVVVPLAFILIVAYLSIFIGLTHFEAIVTIQVTALLSAVALYLSLPKLDADTATISDRIFVFNYMVVSVMIVISIMRANRFVASSKWLKGLLWMIHVIGIPMLVIAMGWYVNTLAGGDS